VGRRADVQHFVKIAAEAYDRIDILFNNSGSDEGSGDLLAVDDGAIEACIASNLKSVILCCQAVVPVMIAGDGGSIVTTASITGMRGQNGLGVYGAAKAGVINFMRYIAWEYGPLGIRANSICPGAINTPLLRAGMQDPAAQPVVQYFLHQAPLQRIGEPADIAETALFLASSASAHITGQAIPVDGGMTCGTFLDPTRITSFARGVLDRTTALEA
jgi:3-oxoacyl-[acyl-carrier protein] reductase